VYCDEIFIAQDLDLMEICDEFDTASGYGWVKRIVIRIETQKWVASYL
jgi:hypothetical protein